MSHESIDVAIVTVREDENHAVLDKLGKWTIEPPEPSTKIRTFARGTLLNSSGRACSIAVIRTPEQGPIAAYDTTRDLIEDVDPKWIVVVGIAGAIPEREFTLGDVVIGTRLHDFIVGAYLEGVPPEFTDQGGPMKKDVQDLIALLPALRLQLARWTTEIGMARPPVNLSDKKLYGSPEWKRVTKSTLEYHFGRSATRSAPTVTARAIASSGLLIKSTSLVSQWRKSARDLIAVEMELAGIYAAAHRSQKEYPVLAIRGISDIIGYKRDAEWTEYACKTAATLCFSLLKILPARYLEFHAMDTKSVLVPPWVTETEVTPPLRTDSESSLRGSPLQNLGLLALGLFKSPVTYELLGKIIGLRAEDQFAVDLSGGSIYGQFLHRTSAGIALNEPGRTIVQGELERRPELKILLLRSWERELTNCAAPFSTHRWRNRPRLSLRQNGEHLVELAKWAVAHGKQPVFLRLLPALREYYDLVGNWEERLRLSHIGIEYAADSKDYEALASIKISLAWLLSQQGKVDDATQCAQDAISHSRVIDDPAWECESLVTYAIVLRRASSYDRAAGQCNLAMELLPRLAVLDRFYAEAWIRYELGLNALQLRDLDLAQQNVLAARQVLRVDDVSNPSYNLEFAWLVHTALGRIEQQRGNVDTAGAKYLQALSFFGETGSKGQVSTALYLLATLHFQKGETSIARKYASEALQISHSLSQPSTISKIRDLLSKIPDPSSDGRN